MAALTILAGIGWAALRLPMPLLVMEPGPTTDVSRLIQIESPTFKSKGSYLLTTALISSTEGVTLPDAIAAVLDRDKDLVSRESIFPADSTRVNTDRVHAAQMTESQESAAVAALHELDMPSTPDGAFVREVDGEAPAARKLRPGDVIVAVDGRPVPDPAALQKAIEGKAPGEEVVVTVRRDGGVADLRVRAIEAGDDKKGKARLGVLVIPKRKPPLNISIDAGSIGGPSAGLVFALAIYDVLTPGDLTGGREIAGTGAITNTGERFGLVTPVGAVGEKVSAAAEKGVDVFLVPEPNLDEARRASPEGIEIIGVKTLHEAIDALDG